MMTNWVGKACPHLNLHSDNLEIDEFSSNSGDTPHTVNGTGVNNDYLVESHVFDLHRKAFWKVEEGEKEIEFMRLKVVDVHENKLYSGDLMITRYKLVFKPFDAQREVEFTPFGEFDMTSDIERSLNSSSSNGKTYIDLLSYKSRFFIIPVHMLYSVEVTMNKKNANEMYVDIETKDFRTIRFIVNDQNKGKELWNTIRSVAFPNVLSKEVFALKYKYTPPTSTGDCEATVHLPTNGWDIYDMRREFERQGIDEANKNFRIELCWYISKGQSICETYPHEVYVPAKIDPISLRRWAEFRTKRRFPALSYYYQYKGSSLWRSSQNMPGMMSRRCEDDEFMLKQIGLINSFTSNVAIYDARSQIKAYSNRIKGGGYENTDYYTNCNINFWGIDNIFGVSKAYKKLFTSVNSQLKVKNNTWIFSTIESSNWYNLIKTILETCGYIAHDLHANRKSVLVHCSDGWDRTAEMCSLTQILLDPYSRTLEGFEVLIEKEWISFGHSFETRWGHLCDDKTKNIKRSPIFVQFLDWVYQLLRQFPTCFEFNTNLLCFLAHHVYSWKFGTFLLDTQKYRHQNKLKERTVSIWTYVNANAEQFLNPFYVKFEKKLEIKPDHITLHFWKEYFLQWTEFSDPLDDHDWFVQSDPKAELMKKMLAENKRLRSQLKSFEREQSSAAVCLNGSGSP